MNEKTELIVSIASRPGQFGRIFHNEGYRLLGLNYLYFPMKVEPSQLEKTMELVRNNFRGCGVSMPHKIEVKKYIDELDESAIRTGAVNTILNDNSCLRGYNTDYFGAREALTGLDSKLNGKRALVYGAGGASRAICLALKDLGAKVSVTNRTEDKAVNLASDLCLDYVPLEEANREFEGYLLANATPVGMSDSDIPIFSLDMISRFEAVMDVVVNPRAKIIGNAISLGKKTIPGTTMTVYQAQKQFEIYTGHKLPAAFITSKIKGTQI